MKRYLLISVLILTILFLGSLSGCSLITTNETDYDNMTEKQLCALSDADLNMAIIARTDSHGNAADEEILTSLNSSVRAAYAAALFDLEVQNGGLCQYFTNPSRYTAKYLSNALILIGATQTEKTLSNFIKENNIDITGLSKFESDTEEEYMLNYESYPFDEFDNAFYDNYKTESLESLNAKFIRDHISDFIN